MAERWFQLREVGSGTVGDPYRPEYVESMGLDYTGNKKAPDGAPWLVRVYGTDSELDTLAGKSGATELLSVPTDALNQMLDQTRDAEGWERGFSADGS